MTLPAVVTTPQVAEPAEKVEQLLILTTRHAKGAFHFLVVVAVRVVEAGTK
jgi:hypothetical protein